QLGVEQVRKTGYGKPVRPFTGSDGPPEPRGREAATHVRVVANVEGGVVVDEVEVPDLRIPGECREEQNQIDRRVDHRFWWSARRRRFRLRLSGSKRFLHLLQGWAFVAWVSAKTGRRIGLQQSCLCSLWPQSKPAEAPGSQLAGRFQILVLLKPLHSINGIFVPDPSGGRFKIPLRGERVL